MNDDTHQERFMNTQKEQIKNTIPSILLVEDERIVQMVHLAMLKKLGCQVDLAETGEEALAKFSNGYDLIFMDIGLPDIRGTKVTEEIRRSESGSKPIPIVVLTAYSEEEIEAECLAAGANAMYKKPITATILEEILKEYGCLCVTEENVVA